MAFKPRPCLLLSVLALSACTSNARLPVSAGTGTDPVLPPPHNALIPTVHIAPAERWRPNEMPQPASGLKVTAFARGLGHPRWLDVLPNGDVLVAESNGPKRPENATGLRGWIKKRIMARAGAGVPSADRILLLRDADHDGVAEERHVFRAGLNSPFGMALVDDTLYVADTDALLAFVYHPGDTHLDGSPRQVSSLPAGPINHHWTKNVVADPDSPALFVSVGSNSNVGENGLTAERGRAAIWRIDPTSGAHRVYARGLRNPNGMAWVPEANGRHQLWVSVNERDEIGGDLVPDYMTPVVADGFYGWPFTYYGDHPDPRAPSPVGDHPLPAIVPDYALGPHTASLGLAYSSGDTLAPRFGRGMFVGQHGSWNRRPRSGYRVIFVAFDHGRPVGAPTDVLGGFVVNDKAHGRPVGVATDGRGGLLVADDVGNAVWRVSAHPGARH